MAEFFQDAPQLGNQFDDDRVLRWYLERRCRPMSARKSSPTCSELRRAASWATCAELAEDADEHPPRLVQFDPWGRRIDEIETARGWRELDRVSAEEGLVAIGYERRFGPLSRVYQFAKLYLFSPASATYTCPLAMTDGAARAIEVHGDAELRAGAYRRLTSPRSRPVLDLGPVDDRTHRRLGRGPHADDRPADHGAWYRLHGTKWFTSATTSQMAMTLARIEDAQGRTIAGSRGLSLFYLETRDAAGRLNDIAIHRLKDKLGTRSLPTAELTLDGTPAKLVGSRATACATSPRWSTSRAFTTRSAPRRRCGAGWRWRAITPRGARPSAAGWPIIRCTPRRWPTWKSSSRPRST